MWTKFFVILDLFLPFYPLNNQKNQNFEKMQNKPGDIIWHMCTINDDHMSNEQNFLSFWTNFALLPPKNPKMKKNTWRYYHFTHMYHKWQSYDVWFLIYQAWWPEFFVILDCFLPFYPPNLKNQNFEKLKKVPGDIIILHKCTKNHDHKLYCSWDMACNSCNHYFPFWAIFCPFTSLTAQKVKIKKKNEKVWRYNHFTYAYQKLWSDDVQFMMYSS